MGCTRNFTAQDYVQFAKSLQNDARKPPVLERERLAQARGQMNKATSEKMVNILSQPDHPARQAVSNYLVRSMNSKMSDKEEKMLPEAFLTILQQQPDAMGILQKPPVHRGPGASAVQHHYEVFATATLMKKSYKTDKGSSLVISEKDRLDFGIKMARGYAQPKRFGTIEADMLVYKNPLLDHKTLAIDAKHSKTGKYGFHNDIQRQLEGVRTGLRDGKIHGFYYVTNGTFGDRFKAEIDKANLMIARDYFENQNLLFHDDQMGIDKRYLTDVEKEHIPPEKIPLSSLTEYNESVREIISRYKIPQIDLCEYVTYPGTENELL
jgi:hypothetical protein